jgi:hypothetical protein
MLGPQGDEGAPGFGVKGPRIPPRKTTITNSSELPRTNPEDLPATPYAKTNSILEEFEPENRIALPRFGKDKPVRYLNEQERAAYEVHVKNGKLYDNTGSPLDSTREGKPGIFVMSPEGRIYFAQHSVAERGVFHHSSFLGGKPVAAAGELHVRNGEVLAISRQSGHHEPSSEMNEQFKAELARRGVPGIENVPVKWSLE